ncbi:hypothetical protein [Paenibacillus sp. DYY-L-2]|uniref:hypothetical protein n=1 Tax=Paenibacillus sp. DYY-L-2 TaxID=3447013 RepID=UPI003F503C60
MTNGQDLDLESFREWMDRSEWSEEERGRIRELIETVEKLSAENARLRKTILRLSSGSSPRMSSKLRDALYE